MDNRNIKQSGGWLTDVPMSSVARDLYHKLQLEDELALGNFKSQKQARALAKLIAKCKEHKLTNSEREYTMILKALQGVGAHRALLASLTDMKVAVPEFYGGSIKTLERYMKAQRNGKESEQQRESNV